MHMGGTWGKEPLCFTCGSDVCVYIHQNNIWKDKELIVMKGYSGEVRLKGREFFFIIIFWLFL